MANATHLSHVTVLVVDDDDDVRDLTVTVLEQAGAHVEAACSASEALGYLASKRYDVLVCDIAMPVIDGVSLIRALRSMAIASSRTPAIALTSFCSARDKQEMLEAGFDRHLGKTSSAQLLVENVGELCARDVRKAS